MHRAPAVNFSVKRSRWHARFVVCLTLLSMGVSTAFMVGQALMDIRTVLLFTAVLMSSGVALVGWKQSPQGTLRWDGEHWFWSAFNANPVCRLRLLMDFQRVVLVSIASETHKSVYLWLEAVPGDSTWKPLRRALVSSQAGDENLGKHADLLAVGDPA